jgi:hypothetical protein
LRREFEVNIEGPKNDGERQANLPASVRQRLLNLSRERHDDFQRIITQYALERLLYRISRSADANQFILKGAMLFLIWMEEPHRRTRDLDLLGVGDPTPERLSAIFRDICRLQVEPDGLTFDPETIAARHIREDNIYGGIRVTLEARLENARIPLQIDVGFGDSAVPDPEPVEFPTLLPFPAPRVRAYVRETVIAEKLHALIALDMDNSRMKDFFDLWTLAKQFSFDGERLSHAVSATFARRGMSIPPQTPTGLTPAFSRNPAKHAQWKGFARRSLSSAELAPELEEVVGTIASMLEPILSALRTGDVLRGTWTAGGTWMESETSTH